MSKSLRVLGAALCVPALLLASACGAGPGSPQDEPGQLEIVTAFYPFQFVAERVAGASASVESLTSPGAEPHDLELTPRQLIDLSEADVVIYQRGFQAAVDQAVDQAAPEHVVDVAAVVDLQPVPEHDHDAGEPGQAEQADDPDGHTTDEHTDEHTGEQGEHTGEQGEHDHELEPGSVDPHTWLDPENMVAVTEAVRAELGEVSPDRAATFDADAAALTADLQTLDEDFATGLETCERREFITSHAAFGYLASRYDLTQIGISGISPDAEPSPARVAEIHDEAAAHGITTIFTETLVSPATAEAIAGDLGLTTDVLDPLEGLTEQSRGSDYIAVQEANLQALRTANDCR